LSAAPLEDTKGILLSAFVVTNNHQGTNSVNTISKKCLCAVLLGIAIIMGEIPSVRAEPKALYTVDFRQKENTDASTWLKKQGFDTFLDAERLHLKFENEGLRISTNESLTAMFGLKFGKPDYVRDVNHIVIEWGVNRFPVGADWEQGNKRVPIGVIFSFGDEKLSSGLPFGIKDAPYFLSAFIGENEQVGSIYVGALYAEGGRYFCVSNGAPVGQTIATNFEVDNRFKDVFNQDKTPPITGLAFEMNTDNTEGGAEAFIKKIVFYSK
jgi:hypothetical protein